MTDDSSTETIVILVFVGLVAVLLIFYPREKHGRSHRSRRSQRRSRRGPVKIAGPKAVSIGGEILVTTQTETGIPGMFGKTLMDAPEEVDRELLEEGEKIHRSKRSKKRSKRSKRSKRDKKKDAPSENPKDAAALPPASSIPVVKTHFSRKSAKGQNQG